MSEKRVHEGRNVKRFREMLGIKQEALAAELGSDWNQKKISLLEARQAIDEDILHDVAKVLKVPTEAIKNFDEESVINIINNTFTDFKDYAIASPNANQCTFNPIDKIVELYEERIALYERMLRDREEMIRSLSNGLK